VVFFIVTCLLVYVLLFHRAPSVNPAASSGLAWRLKEDEPPTRLHSVPIILYHNLDGKGPFSLPSDVLRMQFTMLREKNVGVISLADFISRLENPAPLHRPAVAVTFDDGFHSMYTTLLPISMEFNYPITLFVYTDNIRHRAKKSLTWEQLREMETKGISVESHTITHADLVKLQERDTRDSRRRLFEEIYLSKRIMQLYLDKNIRYFAFPYGRYNLPLIRLCEHAGYSRVFSTDYGSNVLTRDNYCLRRRHIKRDYTPEMIEKIIE
jgi:peptidoglycan/xylan/chitin deacetylase (PgdA/CDA1 family)